MAGELDERKQLLANIPQVDLQLYQLAKQLIVQKMIHLTVSHQFDNDQKIKA